MDVAHINPFLEAIVEVLSMMADTEVKPKRPSIKKDQVSMGVVTGTIGLTGKDVKGSLAITFTEQAILAIARKMLEEEKQEVDGMVADLVGELANMVSGGARERLESQGFDLEIALPTTIRGPNHIVTHSTKGPVLFLPFDTDNGPFYVEVCFVSTRRAGASPGTGDRTAPKAQESAAENSGGAWWRRKDPDYRY